MSMNQNNNSRKCFIITPIGTENDEIFRKAKGVIESVIKPVLSVYGFDDVKPAYEINLSGMINTQIINRIIDDDLVIANLTDKNPNVMYELCLRHVVAKPIIHICENGTTLPFDIKDNRTIFYVDDMLGVEELKTRLRAFLNEIDFNKQYRDNPIYVATKYGKLLKETQETQNNEMHEILELLLKISNDFSEAKRFNFQSKSNRVIFDDSKAIEGYDVVYDSSKLERILSNVSIKELERIANKDNEKMKVHELAKELNMPSVSIVFAANVCGIPVKNHMVTLNKQDVISIVTYFKFLKCTEENII